jgi:hypothetical protein
MLKISCDFCGAETTGRLLTPDFLESGWARIQLNINYGTIMAFAACPSCVEKRKLPMRLPFSPEEKLTEALRDMIAELIPEVTE